MAILSADFLHISANFLMKKCYNCDKAVAIARCLQCPPKASFYCKDCKDLHNMVKSSKNHVFAECFLICDNCEKEPSIQICKECSSIPNQDAVFCSSCANVHVKIRQFRGHHIIKAQHANCLPTTSAESALAPSEPLTRCPATPSLLFSSSLRQCGISGADDDALSKGSTISTDKQRKLSWFAVTQSCCSDILENALNILPENTVLVDDRVNWRSVGKGFAIAFVVHFVTSFLFGKKTVVFYCIIALFVFALYYRQQAKVHDALEQVKQVSIGIKDTYQQQLKEQKTSPFGTNVGLTCDINKLGKSFPGEFWYSKDGSAHTGDDQDDGHQSSRSKSRSLVFESVVASKIKKRLGTAARREQSDEVLRNTKANAAKHVDISSSSLNANSRICARPHSRTGNAASGGDVARQRVNFLVDALYN